MASVLVVLGAKGAEMTAKEDAKKRGGPKAVKSAESREDRLSAALRANLKRRKAQARSRKTDELSNDLGKTDESS